MRKPSSNTDSFGAWCYSLPGKSLLLGEYGLLLGFPGVAVTLPSFLLKVSCWTQPSLSSSRVVIKSLFFRKGQVSFSIFEDKHSDDTRFFQALVSPYRTDALRAFADCGEDFFIHVVEAFPPHLGFGSSSAILASVHAFLFSQLSSAPPLSEPLFLDRLFAGLHAFQGRGSGYDAILQLAARNLKESRLWTYTRSPESLRPKYAELNPLSKNPRPHHFGTILQTGVYADTKAALKKFTESDATFFARAQGELARAFIANPDLRELPGLVMRAQELQNLQGILPRTQLVSDLQAAKIPFKSLGAGLGDCLWSPLHPSELASFKEHILTEVVVP